MAAMWTFALARLAGILVLGLCVGLLIGPIWVWILGSACLYLAWQLLNLYRLDRWLRLRSQIDPPNVAGIWGDIIAQVIRLHRRKQYHKQRLVQLYRELRRSTAALPDGVIILSAQREIVWFNRQAARLLGLRRPVDIGLRIDNLIRSPEFAHYLHSDDFGHTSPRAARCVFGTASRALRRRAVAAPGSRCHATDAPRSHAQRLRRQRLARAAHALDRDYRVLGHPGRRPRGRSGLGWAHQGYACSSAAHECHHRRPAGAVTAGVDRWRSGARSDRRAAHAGAAAPRCLNERRSPPSGAPRLGIRQRTVRFRARDRIRLHQLA